MEKIELSIRENDQRSRLNNIEIKSVPVTSSENLFDIVSQIGIKNNCNITRDNINYIARIPQRNNKNNKNIVVSVHNRYLRDNFIAAAKKCPSLKTTDLVPSADGRIYINDHLTFENQLLLNKAKALAKEKGFAYIWVKNCTILVKRNATSPTLVIKLEMELKKIA